VAIRPWIPVLLLTAISLLAGCGGGSTVNIQNPAPAPLTKVAIAFQPEPATSLLVDSTTSLTAVVSNDPGNYGVDWVLTCQTADCGSLSSRHSDSGQEVTYTPPQALPANSQSVTIVAYATADHTENATASITITAFGSGLKGTYVFQTKGSDSGFQPYQLAGVIILDGNGGISSGQQTLNTLAGSVTTPISASSYFIGGDGRGTITLNTTDSTGALLTEHFALVVLSNSEALIAENDAPQSSSGTLELQTSTTAAPTGGYAFVMSGIDAGGTPAAFGGILNIDNNPTPGSISGKGSIADEDYFGSLSTCSSASAFSGSSVSQPSPNPFGLIIFNVSALNPNTGVACLGFGFITVTGYMVDASHVKLIETDGGFLTAGIAVSQGSATGTFSLASLSGTYVWGVLGEDVTSLLSSSLTSAGVLSTDGAGNIMTGFTDSFMMLNQFTFAPAQSSAQFSGTYTIDSKGIGRVRPSLSGFVPSVPFRPPLIFYLTGNGNPALVLYAGGESLNYPALGVGIAYPQSAERRLGNGKYGISFTQQNGSENDGTSRVTVDLAASLALSGIVDDLRDSAFGVGSPLNGTLGSQDSFGRIAGTWLVGNGVGAVQTKVEYYTIDSAHGFIIETDLLDPQSPSGQVSLGSYAARTPVCDGCP
jgi:hypothetical protein